MKKNVLKVLMLMICMLVGSICYGAEGQRTSVFTVGSTQLAHTGENIVGPCHNMAGDLYKYYGPAPYKGANGTIMIDADLFMELFGLDTCRYDNYTKDFDNVANEYDVFYIGNHVLKLTMNSNVAVFDGNKVQLSEKVVRGGFNNGYTFLPLNDMVTLLGGTLTPDTEEPNKYHLSVPSSLCPFQKDCLNLREKRGTYAWSYNEQPYAKAKDAYADKEGILYVPIVEVFKAIGVDSKSYSLSGDVLTVNINGRTATYNIKTGDEVISGTTVYTGKSYALIKDGTLYVSLDIARDLTNNHNRIAHYIDEEYLYEKYPYMKID